MRLTDLLQARVRTLDGEALGRVHEVHCDQGKVTALVCGASGWIERFTGRSSKARRVPWECVRRMSAGEIVVSADPPQQEPSAARSRRGTRRPSGPRSRR